MRKKDNKNWLLNKREKKIRRSKNNYKNKGKKKNS
jgi:hypothetical protein